MPNGAIGSETDTEKEVVDVVVSFVREVLGKGAGFIPETVYKKYYYLWIIRGEIKYMGDYTYILSYFSEIVNKSSQELIDILNNLDLTKKVIESLKNLKFCFYVDIERKKLCAFNLDFKVDFSDKIPHIKEEDADAKDICKKAKEFLSAGTTFRYFDFLPIVARCDEGGWRIFALVSYYTGFDVIPRLYYFEYSRDGAFKFFKGF